MTPRRRLAVIVSRFNRAVTERLLEGARTAARARDASLDDRDIFTVPGAFELPIVAARLAGVGRYDGIVCLGAVIRGETPHFEYVCEQAAAGIQRVALDSGIPVAFGVLTTDTVDQAMERAGGSVGNKGYDSVIAVLDTLAELDRAGSA